MLVISLRTGGVLDWVSNIRTSYIEKRYGNGIFSALAQSSLSASFFSIGLTIQSLPLLFLTFIPFLFCSFLLGSKGLILGYFILFLFFSWLIGGSRQILYSLVFMAFPIFGIMIFNLALSYFASNSQLTIFGLFRYFDHCLTSQQYYKDYLRLLVYLMARSLSSFLSSVPVFYSQINLWSTVLLTSMRFIILALHKPFTPAFGCGVFNLLTLDFTVFCPFINLKRLVSPSLSSLLYL